MRRRTDMWEKAVFVGLGVLGFGLLVSEVILPKYVTSPRESRARVLVADVATMRAIFSQYTLDHHKRPQILDELVSAGYIKTIPRDPMTGRIDTWVLEWSDDPKTPGIIGIHSSVSSSK